MKISESKHITQPIEKIPKLKDILGDQLSFDFKYSSEKDKNKSKVDDVIKNNIINKSYNFSNNSGSLESYKIVLDNCKITSILFKNKVGNKEYKYKVYIHYDLKKEDITHINHIEIDPDDRYFTQIKTTIGDLNITGIQEKARVGYKEIKSSPNYFRYNGLKRDELFFFILDLLKNYYR